MIPREEFLKAIEALKQQNAIDDNFHTHMEAAFPGSYAPIYENVLWALSIHLLELAMEDRYEYVSWWVYETDYGKSEDMTEISWTEDGQKKSVKLTTAEALYDFLVENAKNNDSNEPIVSDSNTKTISMEEFMQLAETQMVGKNTFNFKKSLSLQQIVNPDGNGESAKSRMACPNFQSNSAHVGKSTGSL